MRNIGRKEAVAMLRDALAGSRAELAAAIAANPERWHVAHHFGLGIDVRNLLRRRGYRSESIYGGEGSDLDEEWWMLTQEAITGRRVKRMTLKEYLRRSEEIGRAETLEELEAVRRRVLALPESEPRRFALGEQLAMKAGMLGVDLTKHPLP